MPYALYHRKEKLEEQYLKKKASGYFKLRYKKTYIKKGWNPNSGITTRFKKGHKCYWLGLKKEYNSGVKHYYWKGGTRGYYQNIARQTIEQNINRKLEKGEVVHHLDFDYKNNNINNLHLFKNKKEHTIYHNMLRKIIAEELNIKTIGWYIPIGGKHANV